MRMLLSRGVTARASSNTRPPTDVRPLAALDFSRPTLLLPLLATLVGSFGLGRWRHSAIGLAGAAPQCTVGEAQRRAESAGPHVTCRLIFRSVPVGLRRPATPGSQKRGFPSHIAPLGLSLCVRLSTYSRRSDLPSLPPSSPRGRPQVCPKPLACCRGAVSSRLLSDLSATP
ncbi:uncharacterized protein SCHCODRAFT_02633043, partial [Schizophyllum commune H4-8]|uniref:uncharacterized protein n=1 Tax=Schizophyllum commune (strain H4-8 / FGSC 9210) TaxID=578458 RepID=UPI00215F1C17